MPLLSEFAQRKKQSYFLDRIQPSHTVLEIGAGSGWAGEYLKKKGCSYTSIDVLPPADVVGDIHDWKKLGFQENSFDAIVAFEVVEHVDCFDEVRALLKKGGELLFTTPVPQWDWVLKALEFCRLNQKRTSPHSFLIDTTTVQGFSEKNLAIVGGVSQWGIFTK